MLKKWRAVSKEFAHYSFREACGFAAHPQEKAFTKWASEHPVSLTSLFPSIKKEVIHHLDLSVSGTWIGDRDEAGDLELFQYKMDRLQKEVG